MQLELQSLVGGKKHESKTENKAMQPNKETIERTKLNVHSMQAVS